MKLNKADVKKQNELLNLIRTKEKLSYDERWDIYENFNPGILGDVSSGGAFFTPVDLAQDVSVMAPKRGHILDICGGIGCLSYRLLDMDSSEKNIKSLTIIELNPAYVEIGKKLLPQANWINGDAFDKDLLDSLVKDMPDNRFDLIVSNPPFGKIKTSNPFTNYVGSFDLMVLELCLRYAKNGYFILPQGSVPWKFSGERYYQERIGRDLKKFIKVNNEYKFNLTCDGIDCDIYRDDWKNLNGIGVEAVNVDIYPWSLDCEQDSITVKESYMRE